MINWQSIGESAKKIIIRVVNKVPSVNKIDRTVLCISVTVKIGKKKVTPVKKSLVKN